MDRARAFRRVCEAHGIPLEASIVRNTKFSTDGHLVLRDHPPLITEARNLWTNHAGPAELQVFGYYLEFIKGRKDIGRAPCFLVYYVGTDIGFGGAVVGMKVQFERLTPTLSFEANYRDRRRLEPIARSLYALRQGVESLQTIYAPTEDRRSSEEATYPYRNFYMDGERRVTFEYRRRLFPEKLLFECIQKEERTALCVKFTLKYSPEAHKACGDHGVAPKLYSAERLPGGWWMVVMEYLSEDEYSTRSSVKVDVIKFKGAIKDAVDVLHVNGFVHGDIRACNIMVCRWWDDDIGMKNVKLIDFDWAGRVGEARYPANVNYTEIMRPEDAKDGLVIKKEHDLEMLEKAVSDTEATGRHY
ncbi:SubName: Full=Uncharacterized protein {ECO:0000313/EMBL:CCA77651.1} [Serendipita indica DSM 11827]|nr:SubName: Full=Uncharacterized protein {ECO:0000313/EMBL:CCA77651.1} [Serendipita indica DSM 11827]